MQITISGFPGSGKTTVGRMLAEELGYTFFSIGDIRREIAKRKDVTILELNKSKEDNDTEVDNYQMELGQRQDNIIVEGRMAFHFLPNSIKFFFDVDVSTATERIFKDQRLAEKKYLNKETLYLDIKKRMANDKKRYREIYSIDAFDKSNFDYVIDTTDKGLGEVKEEILKKLNF
ncbi:MAG: cytidylate kinase family protein [Nanoarchaeota archaeon]|nr:cytidylate kinase family protein [Nanoarchaeota archaeon]